MNVSFPWFLRVDRFLLITLESEMFSEEINESQLTFELCLIPFQLKLRILPKEDLGLNSDLKFFSIRHLETSLLRASICLSPLSRVSY